MKYSLALLLLLPSCIFAQQSLTLEEAVLGQYRQFAPAQLNQAQWIPGTHDVVYFSARYDQVMRMDVENGDPSPLFGVEEVSEAIGSPVPHLFGTIFSSDSTAIVSVKEGYFQYNFKSGKAESIFALASYDQENQDFNGEHGLAYTIDNNVYASNGKDSDKGRSVTDYEDGNIVSGQAIARSEFGITKGTFWSPKGNYLAFYQKDESAVADYPLLDITTTPGSLTTIKYPMAGQPSEQEKVGIYSVEKNKTIYLEVTGDKEQYLTNLSWSPDEKYVLIAIVNRDQNHMWLNQYEAATGKFVKTLFEETHDKYVEPEHPAWFVPGKNDEFLWYSERSGFMHLYHYNLEGKLIKPVTSGDWVVLSVLGMSSDGKKVITLTTDESGLNRVVRSSKLSSGATSIITKDVGMRSATLSSDGKYLIDAYSNLETPMVQQVLDANSGNVVKELSKADDPYQPGQLGTTELMELRAEDGTVLHARMIKPSNFDPNKRHPVLVYVYGGPHAQLVQNGWLGGASLWMHYMAQKGYIIFTLDNRGSANRGLDFENVIHRQLGTVEMKDQLVGVDYLKKLPYVDADRMAVHGWSFGGFMTTSLMLRQPGVFQVGVAGGPVTDWKYYEIMYGERYMDRPEQNKEGYETASLLNHVKNLQGDLLLIHGTVDDVVVMQHNLSLVKRFVDEGILVDFFPYPNHPHNVRGKDRVHLITRCSPTLKKN